MFEWPSSCVDPNTGVATLGCLPFIFNNFIYFLIIMAGVVAVYFVVASGIKFIVSGGEPEKVAQARKSMTFALVGLFIVVAAFIIVNFIGRTLGVGR